MAMNWYSHFFSELESLDQMQFSVRSNRSLLLLVIYQPVYRLAQLVVVLLAAFYLEPEQTKNNFIYERVQTYNIQ